MKRSRANYKATKNVRFADNTNGDISEGDSRDMYEDAADSFLMLWDDIQLLDTAAGGNAYTVAGVITEYLAGFLVLLKINATSTGAVTLNINSLGAKKVFKTPTTQAGSGDLVINQVYLFIYDTALDSAAGGFLIVGGGKPLALQRVTLDVSGATPTMDMGGEAEKVFVGSGTITADKELAFSNAGSLIRATTFLVISGTRAITMPSTTITDVSKWSWTKPGSQFIWSAEAGTYRLEWAYDGTNHYLDIHGLYSSTL